MSHPAAPPRPRLLVVVGPTAVGKTYLSIELAERLGGEIISADSRCLYRGLDIGTAKPSAAERSRVPHHLVDVTTPDRPWSLAQYHNAALDLIGDINRRGRLPLLVGGTGQYIFSILDGWTIPPGEADVELRRRLLAEAERDGADAIHRRLQVLDRESADRLDPRNVRRVVRALEVSLTTGRPYSAQRRRTPPNYHVLMIGLTLPRAGLYKRLDARVEKMLADGLVAEVEFLAARGYDWSLPALSAIGYRQIGMQLRNEISPAEAVRLIKRDTRSFVRQQANWFRPDDPRILWQNVEQLDIGDLTRTIQGYFGIAPR